MLRDAGIMLAAGVGIPILAALNAQLGGRIGAPMAAGVVADVGSAGGGGRRRALQPGRPVRWHWCRRSRCGCSWPGLLMAFYLLSITWIAPRFGVGNAIFCVLLGQMVAAAVIDHFGLFGARVRVDEPARGWRGSWRWPAGWS